MQSLVHGPVQVFPCVSQFVYYYYYYSTLEGGATASVITEEGVAALDLLIAGSTNKNSVCSVLSLAALQSELSKSGYSKVSI